MHHCTVQNAASNLSVYPRFLIDISIGCISSQIRKTTRHTSSTMSELEWKLSGRIERSGAQTHYRRAIATDEDGDTETFKIGDCAYMRGGGEDEWWVGVILDLYYDAEAEKKGDEPQRAILRWFYDESYLDPNTKRFIGVPRSCLENELFFADDVSYSDNDLNVLVGKAFMFQDKDEFLRNYKEDDSCYLVRCFYSPTPKKSPRLRVLEKGELKFLLNNPSTEEMYNRFANAPASARQKYLSDSKMEDLEIDEEEENKNYAVELEDVDAALSVKELNKLRQTSRSEADEEKPALKRRKNTGEPTILEVMFGKEKARKYRKM